MEGIKKLNSLLHAKVAVFRSSRLHVCDYRASVNYFYTPIAAYPSIHLILVIEGHILAMGPHMSGQG